VGGSPKDISLAGNQALVFEISYRELEGPLIVHAQKKPLRELLGKASPVYLLPEFQIPVKHGNLGKGYGFPGLVVARHDIYCFHVCTLL
jgi:hypothetical protein